ncbi:MAG: hypothetical protein K0Q56_846 [Sporolactobacillus laevolacticus]|jgi:hypothetical protein|nr:hypothetical protein [Sporolactobacillus laevolacticus]
MSARRGISYALRLIFTTAERKFKKHQVKPFYGLPTKNPVQSGHIKILTYGSPLSVCEDFLFNIMLFLEQASAGVPIFLS